MFLVFLSTRFAMSFVPNGERRAIVTCRGAAMPSYKGTRGPPGEKLSPFRSSSNSGSNFGRHNGNGSKSKITTPNPDTEGTRINKCFGTLSRRGADDAISEGRVTVNGKPATSGQRVISGDKVMLDGKLQRW